MAGKDIVTMSQKELKRISIIRKVIDKNITQVEAAGILALSDRQISRILRRVLEEGDEGIIHRSRGRPSHNAIPNRIRTRAISCYRERYEGFGPTLATEKLFEIDKIALSRETLRGWLIEEHIPYQDRKKRPHRQWRERKRCFGEMLQMDGSHHDWFEERGPRCVLMGYVDDATGNVFARFYQYEGTIPAMDSFMRYIKKYGIPQSVYLDRHTTYKSTKKPSIEDELNNIEPLSEVARAFKELGVDIIYANSPQAKGRIERQFRTFQDRLIKEMRLRGIKMIEEANRFLTCYLPVYNRRFSIKPDKALNLHRPISENLELERALCIKTERTLRNDFTIAHNNKLYQVEDNIRAEKVVVEDRIDGSMIARHKDAILKIKEILRRPKKIVEIPKPCIFALRKAYAPSGDHPWRRFKINTHINSYSQKEKVAQKEKGLLLLKT